MSKQKALIVGFGSIGQRHASILMQKDVDVVLMRRPGSERNTLGMAEVYSWEEVDACSATMAFITNPTTLHISAAAECAERGMHLFLEKPIGDSLTGLDDLLRVCGQRNLTTYVAYVLRFHPVITRLKTILKGQRILHAAVRCTSYLPDWRKGKSHTDTYSVSRTLGGGAILDLSHEFDYIDYLFGPVTNIRGLARRVSTVTTDVEDCFDSLISCGDVVVNLHANFMSQRKERSIHVDVDGAHFFADLLSGRIVAHSVHGEREESCAVNMNSIYDHQIQYYLDNIGQGSIMNNLNDASVLYRKIIAFREEAFV